ncbi:MAG: hypothetical protein KC636_00740, partial [Myxococcales bacterium]|nr:hypothetical protein [Myxococcales bacterium]
MPGFLVNAAATVQCSHAGTASPDMKSTKVKVDGQPVILQDATWSISGCASQDPPNGPGNDKTATFSTGSTRVKVEGKPVVLADSISSCVASGTP